MVNAVLYMTDEQFGRHSTVSRSMFAGGAFLCSFFHPFEQQFRLLKGAIPTDGLPIAFHLILIWMDASMDSADRISTLYTIDLAGDDRAPDIHCKTADGVRLPFRGTLFQPWCHMSAMKG